MLIKLLLTPRVTVINFYRSKQGKKIPAVVRILGMSLDLQRVAVVGRGRIWSRGKDMEAIIQDENVMKFLKSYIGKHLDIVIAGVPLKARLLYEQPKRGRSYIGFFLPRRLRPLWEKIRQETDEVDIVFILDRLDIPVIPIIGINQRDRGEKR